VTGVTDIKNYHNLWGIVWIYQHVA